MGTWQKELDKVCAQSETNKKFIEKQQKYYQKVADAAQAFVSGWTKANAQFTKTLNELLDLAEEAAKPAAELMVLEDELTIAQDFGDKAEIKKVEAKMKPLIAAFEAKKRRPQDGRRRKQDRRRNDQTLRSNYRRNRLIQLSPARPSHSLQRICIAGRTFRFDPRFAHVRIAANRVVLRSYCLTTV